MVGRSSQVARGLNTIAANITQNQDALVAYGISVEDANGNLKSTFDVLSELKPKWDEMSDSERVALGVTLAGKNQYKVLASVMSNFSTATEATATALNSAGSAARENARYMESIEARVTAVDAAFQKMSTAVVDSDLVKGILDIVKAMAEFGSTDFGAAVTQFVLLSGLSWGGLQLLGQSILPSIMSSFGATETAIVGFKAALSGSLPVILAITAAIVALVAGVKAIKDAYEKANPSVEQASLNMKNSQESLKEAKNSYANAKQKLEELNNTPFSDRTSEIQSEIEKLQALTNYYEQLTNVRKEEMVASSATYAKSVEKNGISSGYQVTMPVFTGGYTSEGLKEVKEITRVYQDQESAIYAAAAAYAQYNNQIIDISNIDEARAQLAKYGAVIEEISISVPDLQVKLNDIYGTIEDGGKLTPSLIDQYKDLSDSGKQYAEALQIMKDSGIELNTEQESFLSTFNNLVAAYENYIETQAEVGGVTRAEIEARYEAASALSAYAQELINAANAYQIFKDRLSETGDYDDSFKGFSSILSEVISEFDAGQIGSQAFLTGLELLTGQTFTSAEAVKYMNDNLGTLKLLFGDSESGGMGLITALQDLGYASLDANGNLQISIEDFGRLASELNISEGALYSLTEALRVMGIDFQYNADSILENISKMGEDIVDFGDTTTVNFEAYAKAAKQAGMSNDEIIAISEILSNVEGIELTNVAEGIAALGGNAGEASTESDELNSSLNEVGSAEAGIGDTASAVGTLSEELGSAAGNAASLSSSLSSISNFKAPSLGSLLSGLFGHAEGTSYAKEGMSLVNEEGPELIQSGDEAYIAGGGYPTVTHLNEGDRVYTAEETKDILGGKFLKGSIQAHVMGARGITDTGTGNKKTSSLGITSAITTVLKDTLNKLKPPNNNNNNNNSSNNDSDSSKSSSSSKDEYKAEFDEWLKAKKHALAMDEISEAEYYKALEEMNNKYFKDKEEYLDEYRKYEEQIYAWKKKQEEAAAKQAEKEAEELEKRKQEEAKKAEKEAEEKKKAYKAEFDAKLKELDHALSMDEISQEKYYSSLKKLNDKYFKGKEDYQDEYQKYQEKIYAWEKKQEEEKAKQAEKKAEEAEKKKQEQEKEAQKALEEKKKAYKEEFDTQLKELQHALAMDEISQEQYYNSLQKLNNKYFKGKEEYQDEYWKYQEQIYSWEKKKEEEKAKEAEKKAEEERKAKEEQEKEAKRLAEEQKKAYKEEFSTRLKELDHALAMDEISEEEYYKTLSKLNDKYFKGKEEWQEEYWKYQEKIYSWNKKQEEEQAKQAEKAAEEERKAKEAEEKAYKNEFDTWLKNQKHALAMDEISEEEYYNSLSEMNEKYFKDKENYQDEYRKYEEEIYSWRKKKEEELAKQAEEIAKEQEKAYKSEIDSWIKDLAHALAMDIITEEEYYNTLEEINEKYFKDREAYQDEYQKYEEQIYAWRKKQAEEEAKQQEETLKEQIELERKLNDLAKAKATKVKVFQDGQFRYVSDREALAKAQQALSSYDSGTFYASGGVSLVGENGPELRVLNKGDGIIPSDITKNLFAWGSISPNDFKNNGSDIYNFDIDNLSLPDVKNATDFVTGLKSFALQYTKQRG